MGKEGGEVGNGVIFICSVVATAITGSNRNFLLVVEKFGTLVGGDGITSAADRAMVSVSCTV